MRTAGPIAAFVLGAGLACARPPVVEQEKVAPGTPHAGAPAVAAPPPPQQAAPAPACDTCVALLDTPIGSLSPQCAVPADAPCRELDRLRNCMYARLGYDFEEAPEWRKVFEKEPWYRVDPSFEWDRVTNLQQGNAQVLWNRVEKRRCTK